MWRSGVPEPPVRIDKWTHLRLNIRGDSSSCMTTGWVAFGLCWRPTAKLTSADGIQLTIVQEQPGWMDSDRYQELLDKRLDIDAPPAGILKDLIADRRRRWGADRGDR